ncbi:hypothetical protein [Helicobacter pylori]|uniref:hypothetical protein n=1 Tax=Helicobacter pylori TaxID=210 RepID=UPI000BEC866C|nr:hypothetical protein [Helicobacter pylori]MBH0259453.1 hypothetical protein [Helicobacter pylori]MBH0264032.1 hypothetical protein [Helicobacter pylori]PDW63368.1 hypothetical protein BB445_07385 [Helicobacter pylori]WQS44276.1 hypothetical protein KVC65_06880 [Helicobacter pylori]WQS95842.1 hypothetical protein FNE56_07170 [Helicobacter pylori]
MNSYQKLKAKNQELELKCEKLESENQELKDKVGELEAGMREIRSELSRTNDNVERMCDLLLEKMDTPNQKFIYYKGDDNNSVGKLVGIDSKRERSSMLYPYVVE